MCRLKRVFKVWMQSYRIVSFIGQNCGYLAFWFNGWVFSILKIWSPCRYAGNKEQVKNKPGREIVTFLLVCNLAIWTILSLETNRTDVHPVQVS